MRVGFFHLKKNEKSAKIAVFSLQFSSPVLTFWMQKKGDGGGVYL